MSFKILHNSGSEENIDSQLYYQLPEGQSMKSISRHQGLFRDKSKENYQTRTAHKHCVSSPLVEEDQVLHRSAIEQLKSLDCAPIDSDRFARTKKTLQQLKIRKSLSFDKEKIDFSLSSQYVNLEMQNSKLKAKVEQLEQQIKAYQEYSDSVSLSIEAYSTQLKEALDKIQKLEKGKQNDHQLLQQNHLKLEQQYQIIDELQKQIQDYCDNEEKFEAMEVNKCNIEQYEKQKEEMKINYEKALKQMEEEYDAHLITLSTDFRNAKQIGQMQINNLLMKLNEIDLQNSVLKNKLSKDTFLQKSTHISQSICHSKDIDPQVRGQDRFMDRFRNFSKMIDRKLYSSCDSKQSLIYGFKTASSMLERKKQQIKALDSGAFGKKQTQKTLTVKQKIKRNFR